MYDMCRQAGYEAIVINNDPETVFTDYTCTDKPYFEPLTLEEVTNIMKPIGTAFEALDRADDRAPFEKVVVRLNVPILREKPCPTSMTASALRSALA